MEAFGKPGVKSAKHHLVRTVRKMILNYEEFEMVMMHIQSILNFRPLTPILSDTDSYELLTPGHFLIGRPLCVLPELDLTDVKECSVRS